MCITARSSVELMCSPANIASRRPRRRAARRWRSARPAPRRRPGASSSRHADRRPRRRTGRPGGSSANSRAGDPAGESASRAVRSAASIGREPDVAMARRSQIAYGRRRAAAAGSRNTQVRTSGPGRSAGTGRAASIADHRRLRRAEGEHQPRRAALTTGGVIVIRRRPLNSAVTSTSPDAVTTGIAGRPRGGVTVVADPQVDDVEALGEATAVLVGRRAEVVAVTGIRSDAPRQIRQLLGIARRITSGATRSSTCHTVSRPHGTSDATHAANIGGDELPPETAIHASPRLGRRRGSVLRATRPRPAPDRRPPASPSPHRRSPTPCRIGSGTRRNDGRLGPGES